LSKIDTKKYNGPSGTMKFQNSYIADKDFDDFHLFKLDWNSTSLATIDNKEIFRYDKTDGSFDSWPFDGEFNLIVNLAVTNAKCKDGVDDSKMPAEFIIDYIRQYDSE
jgi:hypothetical protein